MRSKISREGDWLLKTFRMQPEAIQMYEYLQFISVRDGIPKDTLFDRIINFSCDYIEKTNPIINCSVYDPRRKVVGCSLLRNTSNRLDSLYKLYQNQLYKAEFIESCIYFFAKMTLTENEFKQIKLKEWRVDFFEQSNQ